MRLIDVDKIIITRQEYVGALTLKERLRRLLESQPTVEAIPIEWIRKWYRRALDNSGFMGDETISVGDLLADWEKENGTEESFRNI